jgi:hypothetical protein
MLIYMGMWTMKDCNFLRNPFGVISGNKDIVWAGMEKLKQQIDNRINIGIKTSASRIVLAWGRYGSGKTHAANFYTKTSYIREKFKVKTKNIKINLPRTSKDPAQAFLRSLVGQLDFNNIPSDFTELKTTFGKKLDDIITISSNDSIITDFVKILLEPNPDLFGETNPEKSKALKNYLFGDKAKTTLNELELPLGIEDDEQVVNLISTLFNCITYEKKLYQSIFLWIDDFEDIVTLTATNQARVTAFLRQLIDKTPNNLTIFLNFTFKGRDDIEDLSIILGDALASRTKLRVEFCSPTEEEALDYLKDLINMPQFREAGHIDKKNRFYPFTEEVAKYIIEHIDGLSIRAINEVFSLILELALIEEKIPKIIDDHFVNTIKDEIASWRHDH